MILFLGMLVGSALGVAITGVWWSLDVLFEASTLTEPKAWAVIILSNVVVLAAGLVALVWDEMQTGQVSNWPSPPPPPLRTYSRDA